MPTKSLPAVSLRTTDRLPAAQIRLREDNYLICRALWLIRRPLFGVESCFLPALREGRSADEALGAGRDVVEGKRHVWTTPSKQGRFGMCAAVGCGHVSGLRCAAL